MSKHRRRVITLLILLAILAGAWSARDSVLSAAGRWLDVGERPGPVDVVVILPGDYNTRPFVAAALIRAELANAALIPRTRLTADEADGVYQTADQLAARAFAARELKPSDLIVLPGESDSTFTDAQAVGRWWDEHPGARIAVVTNTFHTRRSRWVFRHVLGERADQLVFVSAPCDHFSANIWWQSRRGFLAYGSEFVKYALYVLYYGRAWIWLLLAVVVSAIVWRVARRRRAERAAA